MNAVVILNESAGTAARSDDVTKESLQDAFTAAGVSADVRLVSPRQMDKTMLTAISQKPAAIFVGGGDGTVSAAAALLAGTGISLGILPLGTLNHFAKDLGIPIDWREAVTALGRGTVRSVDIAGVNDRTFINNCSVGAYADAVRHREALRDERNHGKWLAMFIASLRVFRRLRRIRFHLTFDAGEHHLRSPFLLVANNRYDGNILAQSLRDRIDEGRIWIYTTRARRHFAILRMAWQALRRELSAASELEAHGCTHATVHMDSPAISAAIDGEIVKFQTPLHFRILPKALQVLVPARNPGSP